MKIFLLIFSILLIGCSQGGGSSSSSSTPNNTTLENVRDLIIDNNTIYTLDLSSLGTNFAITTIPTLGNLSIENNILTYSPSALGSDFWIIENNSQIIRFNINITAENQSPQSENINVFIERGNGKIISPLIIDENTNNVQIQILNQDDLIGDLTFFSSQSLGYDTLNQTYNESIQYKLIDEQGLESPIYLINISVGDPNTPPTLNLSSVLEYNINEDSQSINLQYEVSDDQQNALDFSINPQPNKGVLSGSYPNYTYLPNENENGTDTFSIIAQDNFGQELVSDFTINIQSINDKPIGEDSTVLITKNSSNFFKQLTIIDPDNDNLNFIITNAPNNVQANFNNNGAISIVPNLDFIGNDQLQYKINDGVTDSDIYTIDIVVNEKTPTINLADQIFNIAFGKDNILIFEYNGTTNNLENIDIITNPEFGSVSIVGNNIYYEPLLIGIKNDSFELQIEDELGNISNIAKFDLVIQSDALIYRLDDLNNIIEETNFNSPRILSFNYNNLIFDNNFYISNINCLDSIETFILFNFNNIDIQSQIIENGIGCSNSLYSLENNQSLITNQEIALYKNNDGNWIGLNSNNLNILNLTNLSITNNTRFNYNSVSNTLTSDTYSNIFLEKDNDFTNQQEIFIKIPNITMESLSEVDGSIQNQGQVYGLLVKDTTDNYYNVIKYFLYDPINDVMQEIKAVYDYCDEPIFIEDSSNPNQDICINNQYPLELNFLNTIGHFFITNDNIILQLNTYLKQELNEFSKKEVENLGSHLFLYEY